MNKHQNFTQNPFEDSFLANLDFLAEIMTGKLKPSSVKRSRSKHPTGRGEQKQSKQWGNTIWGKREKDELKNHGAFAPPVLSKQQAIELGVNDWLSSSHEVEEAQETSLKSWTHEDYLDYCEDKGMLVEVECDDDIDEAYAEERYANIKDVMQWDGVEHEYHAPYKKIRTWRTRKGACDAQGYVRKYSSVRLTERQLTADCGQSIPQGYDPYEG